MKEYLDLLEKLIRCRAVTSDIPAVNRATGIMRDFLTSHGLHCITEKMPDNREILYAAPTAGKEPEYLLNAHLDVVPAPAGMFDPKMDGPSMIGRGTSDCQGCAVAIARALVKAGPAGRAGVFFSTDEETGGDTTREMVRLGYRAKKMVIIVDASPWAVCYAQKGIINARLIARGTAGHSSEPWNFDNALDKLIDGYSKIRAAWPEMAPEIWGDSMAATTFHAGDADNRIPDYAAMNLNIRYVKPDGEKKIVSRLEEISGLEVEVTRTSPPVTCDPDHPEIRKLRDAMTQKFQREITLERMCGATDARHFPAGIPVAMLGLEGKGCHSTFETVNTDSIRLYSEMLAEFIA